MGSACLSRARLGVLPDHILPAAEPGAVAAQGQVLLLSLQELLILLVEQGALTGASPGCCCW